MHESIIHWKLMSAIASYIANKYGHIHKVWHSGYLTLSFVLMTVDGCEADLLQSGGGPQCVLLELGALWLWVKPLWDLRVVRPSPCGSSVSGSSTDGLLVVGLFTGVPWTGGEWHGEARGEMLEEGKPVRVKYEDKCPQENTHVHKHIHTGLYLFGSCYRCG